MTTWWELRAKKNKSILCMVFSAFELSTIFMMTFPPLSMLHRSDHEASGVFWGRSGKRKMEVNRRKKERKTTSKEKL